MIETRPKKDHERALLIGLEHNGVSKWDLRDSLDSGQAIDEVFTSACRWREALQRARGEER